MATDSTLPVRRAMLTLLKDDPAMTALVAAASIYPQAPPAQPTWPFIKPGPPAGTPIRASCVDGQEITVAFHGFAKARHNGAGGMLETAEDHAARIGAQMARTLDRRRVTLPGGHIAKITWTGSQLLQDGAERDAFHTLQTFRIRVIS